MDNTYLVSGATLLFIAMILTILWRKYIFKQASTSVQEVFPVWAGQGPFRDGTESARAFKAAYAAVFGPEQADKFQEEIEAHRNAYDHDPNAWEKLRMESLQTGKTIQDNIIVAEGFVALEELNSDTGNGFQLGFVTNDDGKVDLSFQSGENSDLENNKEKAHTYIAEMYGEDLLNAKTDTANELLHFIETMYLSAYEKEPENPFEIGDTLFRFITYSDNNPDDEFSHDFRQLYEAYTQEKH